jgi:RNA polymerase sigma-70 factor (ECF subfamily)
MQYSGVFSVLMGSERSPVSENTIRRRCVMMTPEQEREYIRQARGDPRAFAPIYDHYFDRVYAYVRHRVYDPQDAEDVIADVFCRAIQNLKRFRWRNANSFAGWLFRIAHNLVMDYYRHRKRTVFLIETKEGLVEVADQAPPPEDALAQQEAFQQMRALIATLSPRRQEVITLRFYGGLRNREIAHVLGLDERTVAAHLCRALRDLERAYTAPTQPNLVTEAAT